MTELIWFIFFAGMFFFGYLLYRNTQVYNFRMWLLTKASVGCKADIAAGKPWEWRLEFSDQVSYDTMMWQFWKPLTPETWYPDTSFLRV